MGLVNKSTLNFIVEQSGKLGRSFLTVKPPKPVNLEGLKYMPQQLSTDVVEISQKALRQNQAELNPATLQALADKGLSLNEMAKELGVKVGKIRLHLKRNNIITDAQNEFRILNDYFSAATREDKVKALTEIDKYLEPIAKEEVKLRRGYSYEDCLQDVRLQFFELAAKRENGQHIPQNIYDTIKTLMQTSRKNEIETVGLNELIQKDIGIADKGIELVEENDFRKYFMEKLAWHLRSRELIMLRQRYMENNTIEQIAEYFGLSVDRTKAILQKATERAVDLHEKMLKR